MKKVLIVFDTKYGNTEKLAREIAAGINETGEVEARVVNIDDVPEHDLEPYNGILFGAPIHAFRATRGIRRAVKHAAKKGLNGKLVGAFDTYLAPGHKGKCAQQIEDELRRRSEGVTLHSKYFTALVEGMEGPLKDDEPVKARAFGREFAESLLELS